MMAPKKCCRGIELDCTSFDTFLKMMVYSIQLFICMIFVTTYIKGRAFPCSFNDPNTVASFLSHAATIPIDNSLGICTVPCRYAFHSSMSKTEFVLFKAGPHEQNRTRCGNSVQHQHSRLGGGLATAGSQLLVMDSLSRTDLIGAAGIKLT